MSMRKPEKIRELVNNIRVLKARALEMGNEPPIKLKPGQIPKCIGVDMRKLVVMDTHWGLLSWILDDGEGNCRKEPELRALLEDNMAKRNEIMAKENVREMDPWIEDDMTPTYFEFDIKLLAVLDARIGLLKYILNMH